jgi:hypothetical protein
MTITRIVFAAVTVVMCAQSASGQGTTSPADAVRSALPRVLPGTRASAFAIVHGNALDATNGVLPNSMVRLRDARMGRILQTQTTDTSGLFEFRPVDPGNYVVELVGQEQVLAASRVLTVEAGQTISAVVKLPFRTPPYAGLLGHTVQQALAVTAAAAASGVLAIEVTGEDASPQ